MTTKYNRVQNALQATIQGAVNTRISTLETEIRAKVEKIHDQFFKVMSRMIVNQKEPALGSYRVTYKPLSEKYAQYRKKKYGVFKTRFYKFSGSMQTALTAMDPTTALGAPLIMSKGYGPKGGTLRNLNQTLAGGRKAQISVDPYPKLLDSINDVPEHVEQIFGSKLAYRLSNYKGAWDRPFVRQYFLWWLNVRVRAAVKEAIQNVS